MFLRVLLFFALVSSTAAHAQQFGGNPPSLRWQQLETPAFRVIFPKGMQPAAERVASIGQRILPATAPTIGHRHRKINIVLQNQTMISNGYVGLAPWRSEFFLTPLQNSLQLGSLNWTDLLTLHELRHVQQFANFNKGLSKWASILAGEQGLALAVSASVPDWFYEGDAVFQETLLSSQGRGRLPAFLAEYRALNQIGRRYSYATLRNGSLRKQIPDHYQTGYILVAEARRRFGPDVWQQVTDRAVRYKPLLYPFQGAFKKSTGIRFQTFVKEALLQDSANGTDPAHPLSAVSERFVTDYSFPMPAGKDSFIVLKQSDRSIPAFYWLINGKESRITTADIRIDPAFSYRSGKLAFTSYTPDSRWGWRNYADIILLDLASGKRSRLTAKGKYIAPDLSHDATRIVAIHADPSGEQSLHLLDATTGQQLRSFRDAGLIYTYPRFAADDRYIFVLVRTPDGRMGLQQIDAATGQSSYVLPPSQNPMAFLYVHEDNLYFTAAWKGRDRLMQFNLAGKELTERVSRHAGVQQGVPMNDDTLLFTGKSAWGDRLYTARTQQQPITLEAWKNETPAELPETAPVRLDTIGLNSYVAKKYKHSTRLINLHSWRPLYEQPDWSFTVYGENVLNTFRSSAYFLYNENEGYRQTGADLSFGSWFPWIVAGGSYTAGRNALVNNNRLEWNEWSARAGLRIPLNLTRGRTFQSLSISSLYNLQQVDYKGRPASGDIQIGYVDNILNWSVYSQQARQHIFPRWGLATGMRQRFSVSDRQARQLLVSAAAYLPGLVSTHNLVVTASYQSRDTLNRYIFSNSFPLSRGYPVVNYPRMWKVGFNYHLPLVYPDFGVGNIVYVQRVRANLFYDLSWVKSLRTGRVWNLPSVGTEIFFDTKWWNQQPVSFGFRYSRLLSAGPYANRPSANQVEFILPMNLLPN